jgi:hypothetical protein
LAAHLPRRHRHAERQGRGLLQALDRRAARERDRAVRDALPLGPAAGPPGRARGWRSRETAKAFADYCGYIAAELGDRVRHYFTINEFSSFVEQGYRGAEATIAGKVVRFEAAPGLDVGPDEIHQVRHHTVLGHGLAVQAIRAHGPAGTKVGPAEVIQCAVPLIESPEHVAAAQAATRELNAAYLTVMLEGRYTDGYLRNAGPGAPLEHDGQLRVDGRIRQPLRHGVRRLRHAGTHANAERRVVPGGRAGNAVA